MRLLELAIRTFCDSKPKDVADAAFLFGQTIDNQESVFLAAKRLLKNQFIKKVLIVRSDPKSGYPGHSIWEKELLKMGIPKDLIIGVDLISTISLNTLIEATGMIKHAKNNHYKKIYVIASPFHQLRAFMTSVTVALKYYPNLRIYSYQGNSLSWSDTVTHSQGTTIGPRSRLIRGELDRIITYQQKGDLASDNSIIEYLEKRDSIT